MAGKQSVVVVHLELRTILELRHSHRVDIRIPALHSTAVADVGEWALLLDIEGVADRNHRVGHKIYGLRLNDRREVIHLALGTETAIAEVYLVGEMTLAAVGVISAARCVANETERIVGLHLQRLDDVGEDTS